MTRIESAHPSRMTDCDLRSTESIDDRSVTGEVGAVILAGVHRWGGDVLDRFASRPLLPVALRPLIFHAVEWLVEFGLEEVCVCANSETSAIQKCFATRARSDTAIRYYEDVMPRGPAGCVRDAAAGIAADTIVVIESSVVPRFDLSELLKTHRREKASLTIVVHARSTAEGEEIGAPAGVYVLSKSALSEVAAKGYQDLKEVLVPKLHKAGHRIAVHPVGINSASRVLDAASYLATNLQVTSQVLAQNAPWAGYTRVQNAWIHQSAKVAAGARWKGPVLIGPRACVDAGALVIGPCVVGGESVIQEGAVVSRSVLWKASRVGANVIVDHSVLTNGAQAVDMDMMRDTVLCSRSRFGLRAQRARGKS